MNMCQLLPVPWAGLVKILGIYVKNQGRWVVLDVSLCLGLPNVVTLGKGTCVSVN